MPTAVQPLESGQRKELKLPLSLTPAADMKCNVDYFSYNWDELDLKASWSVMTKKKKTYMDGIRLENASWRKWMQTKFKLRRIPPETLRWKKDEDITWLYGPLCKAPWTETTTEKQTHLASEEKPKSPEAKPVLKKPSSESLVRDWIRFSNEAEKRMAAKFSKEQQEVAKSVSLDIRPSKSEQELYNMRTDQYLESKELDLLIYMDHGPSASNDTPAVSLVGSPSSSPVNALYPKARNKARLRFSSEVEVVKFDQNDKSTNARRKSFAVPPAALPLERYDTIEPDFREDTAHEEKLMMEHQFRTAIAPVHSSMPTVTSLEENKGIVQQMYDFVSSFFE